MKILFEDGDWRLIKYSPPWALSDVQHRCRRVPFDKFPQKWWYYCGITNCESCTMPVPEAMRGLRILTNWDR